MTKFYHYTSKSNIESILIKGLVPGSQVQQQEALPFVMFSRSQYRPEVGFQAYFEVELDENDPRLHSINEDWVEYHGEIAPGFITGLANPPASNDEVFELIKEFGFDSLEFKQAFEYKEL